MWHSDIPVCSPGWKIQDKWPEKSKRRDDFSKKADGRKRKDQGGLPRWGDSRKTRKLR